MRKSLLENAMDVQDRIFLNEQNLKKYAKNTEIYKSLSEQIEKDKTIKAELDKVFENPEKYGFNITD